MQRRVRLGTASDFDASSGSFAGGPECADELLAVRGSDASLGFFAALLAFSRSLPALSLSLPALSFSLLVFSFSESFSASLSELGTGFRSLLESLPTTGCFSSCFSFRSFFLSFSLRSLCRRSSRGDSVALGTGGEDDGMLDNDAEVWTDGDGNGGGVRTGADAVRGVGASTVDRVSGSVRMHVSSRMHQLHQCSTSLSKDGQRLLYHQAVSKRLDAEGLLWPKHEQKNSTTGGYTHLQHLKSDQIANAGIQVIFSEYLYMREEAGNASIHAYFGILLGDRYVREQAIEESVP